MQNQTKKVPLVNLHALLPACKNMLENADVLSFHAVQYDEHPLNLKVHQTRMLIENVVIQSGFPAKNVSSCEEFWRETKVDDILKIVLDLMQSMYEKSTPPVLIHAVITLVITRDGKRSYESSVRILNGAIPYDGREKTRHGSIFTNLWLPRSYVTKT